MLRPDGRSRWIASGTASIRIEPVIGRYSDAFKRQLKRLSRRYRHIRGDVQPLLDRLSVGETLGDRIQAPGYVLYKVRVRNSDAARGKSGGYRIIYYVQTERELLLVAIYCKSDPLYMIRISGATLEQALRWTWWLRPCARAMRRGLPPSSRAASVTAAWRPMAPAWPSGQRSVTTADSPSHSRCHCPAPGGCAGPARSPRRRGDRHCSRRHTIARPGGSGQCRRYRACRA